MLPCDGATGCRAVRPEGMKVTSIKKTEWDLAKDAEDIFVDETLEDWRGDASTAVCYTVSSSAECMAGVHDRANSSTRQRIACVDEFYNPVSRGGWARQPASATQFPFRTGRASAMASPRPAIPGAPAICSDH